MVSFLRAPAIGSGYRFINLYVLYLVRIDRILRVRTYAAVRRTSVHRPARHRRKINESVGPRILALPMVHLGQYVAV